MIQAENVCLQRSRSERAIAVDIFCGIGGLTNGMQDAGLKVVAGVDFDKTCDFAFEANNQSKFLHRDVTTIKASEIKKLYPKGSVKVLVGCAPCQPFSQVPGEREDKDGKWRLLYSFADMIAKVKPSVVSMENVPQLNTHRNGIIIKDFTKRLEDIGYKVTIYKVNAANYGVPQRRYRLILFASKFGKVELIPKIFDDADVPTVADAIRHLPHLQDGECDPNDSLHKSRKLKPINKQRIQSTTEGGSWKDWPPQLLEGLNCRSTTVGQTFTSAYGRMAWHKPSPTLTTHCTGLSNGSYGHPEQDRAITLREAALLQSFPGDYKFDRDGEESNVSDLARHIGNAVPPLLGKAIGISILNHLEQHQRNGRKAKVAV